MPLRSGVRRPIPPLVAGWLTGEEWIEHLSPEAILVPAWPRRLSEVVQADHMRVIESIGDSRRQGALARAPRTVYCDEHRSFLAISQLLDVINDAVEVR